MMNDKNTHPALGLEKVVTRDDALEALDWIQANTHPIVKGQYATGGKHIKTIRQALEQSFDGGWNFNMDECPKNIIVLGRYDCIIDKSGTIKSFYGIVRLCEDGGWTGDDGDYDDYRKPDAFKYIEPPKSEE